MWIWIFVCVSGEVKFEVWIWLVWKWEVGFPFGLASVCMCMCVGTLVGMQRILPHIFPLLHVLLEDQCVMTWEFANSCCSSVTCSVVSNSLRLHGLEPARVICPWNSPDKKTGVGCHFFLQGIFLTQGSNPHCLRCRQILYHWATGEAWTFVETSN